MDIKDSVINHQDHIEKINEANKFFHIDGAYFNIENTNTYKEKDGLVQFIIATQLSDQKDVQEKTNSLSQTLIALSSIATNYVNKHAEKHGEKYKTDMAFWTQVVNKLPLMGTSKVESKNYTDSLTGLSISKSFLHFIMNVVVFENTDMLANFADFLTKQGETIRLGIRKNKGFYSTLTLTIAIDTLVVGEKTVYIPKLKLYRINFDSNNSNFLSSCASNENVNIDFEYSSLISVLDYEALEHPDLKASFDNFINKHRKISIEDSDDFFSGEFDPT
ncbi:hypothetical protein BB987_01625 [Photorhabdus temperata]|uniref:Virulence factor Evf domain-containing protein n=1 Tax=Photorhabdus khanii NC19 TaxID=1004151 RepID=W3V400_9GAMM|nr:hypothetical protein [Photorhabdus khanii]ETS30656.1 hypothetical protein PTE_02602 [Photorhabdus khanii NC19]OHV54065.1 hypothetical protein BB987_01625 [Photorhabdus temperata]